jgi:hypothetical protein
MILGTTDGIIAAYCTLSGISIFGLWIYFSARKQSFVSRYPRKLIEVTYHVAAEFLTAIFLVAAGLRLLFDLSWARVLTPLSLGMLLYGPGFYAAQTNRWFRFSM